MAEIIYSPAAIDDLKDIWLHIADRSVWQADRFMIRLKDNISYVAEHNGRGHPRPELAENLRGSPFENYSVYYRQTVNGIAVVRVIHSARDLKRVLF